MLVIVTPSGARIDLTDVLMGALMSAAGDRFFMDMLHGLRLFDSAGHEAALTRSPRE